MRPVIAADIGGTNIRMAAIDHDGRILADRRCHAGLSQLAAENQTAAEAMVIDILADALPPFVKEQAGTALGIGFPGFFIGDSGCLAASPNLPMLRDFQLAARLSERLGIRIAAQNDALCAAIGEQRFGAGQGTDSLLHITLGTGIGGGLILNDTPYTGSHGMAMEFGHLIIDPASRTRCGCGNYGCVETLASATAVARDFAAAGHPGATAHDLLIAAENGNADAIAILTRAGGHLGHAIAEAIKLLDLDRVTISGGLIGAWEHFYPSLMAGMDARLLAPQRDRIHVLRSELADRAGLLGAASLVL